jgi:hypothetical protein
LDVGDAVLIYREEDQRINTREALARVADAAPRSAASADAALSVLIDVSELEAAVVDAVSPERDGLDPLSCAMRDATLAAAAHWSREAGYSVTADGLRLTELLDGIARHTLPDTIAMRVSEGYAYYALFPETYAASAQRLWDALRPARVAVIGIRSIGAGLSAVVAQSLQARGCETWSCTVRPHGHPFDRRLAVREDLQAAWRDHARRGAVFAIVDEGPGLSGSSFASVAHALVALGVREDRIVLFPSWDADAARLKSPVAQQAWRTHQRWCTDAHDTSVRPERVFDIVAPVVDVSAGAWRSLFLSSRDRWPEVQPQHERWKIAVPGQHVIRFAGLGRYGEATRDRAERLNGLGLGPPPGRWRHGFLELPFIAGQSLTACRDPIDAGWIGRYIGAVAREFSVDVPADTSILAHMIETNVGELLGAPLPERFRGLLRDVPADLPAALLDGRMLAHEWIRTAEGLAKVDALDHHRDHFFPGPQSPAWDLAGAIVELQVDDRASAALLGEYERVSGDRVAAQALPFYKVAYGAFRAGYAAVAAETLAGTDEAARFAHARARYVRALTAPSAP